MRVFPKNKWRILVSVMLPILLSFLIHPPRWWAVELRSHSAFLFHSRVIDEIDTITFRDEWWFERYLQQIADESGVDIRFLLVPKVEGESLEAYSVKKARALGLGRDAGRRGLLFVYDASAQRLRLEVGAQLEGVITDAFAGYLVRDHVRSFFGAGNPQLGLFTTLLLVHHRLREGVLGLEFDPRTVEFIEDARRLAVGGGASTVIQSKGAKRFLNTIRPSSRATRRQFAAQPTPAAAYHRYLEWIAVGGYATDVPLFTPLSQGYLGSLTMTRGFNDFLLFYEYNESYRIEIRDSLALLYFTNNPLVGPHFLRRTPEGWALDIYAEILNTRNYAGESFAWGLVESGDDFTVTFADRFIEIGSILRLAGGDNRPLPLRAHHGIQPAAAEPTGTLLEQLTVVEAAQRISERPAHDPLMVILYQTRGRSARAEFPGLVAIANACREAGGDVLAFSVDDPVPGNSGIAQLPEEPPSQLSCGASPPLAERSSDPDYGPAGYPNRHHVAHSAGRGQERRTSCGPSRRVRRGGWDGRPSHAGVQCFTGRVVRSVTVLRVGEVGCPRRFIETTGCRPKPSTPLPCHRWQ